MTPEQQELVDAVEALARPVTDPLVVDLQWLSSLAARREPLSEFEWARLARLSDDLRNTYAIGFNAGRRYLEARSNIVKSEPAMPKIDPAKIKKIPRGVSGLSRQAKKPAKPTLAAKISLEDLGL